MKLLKKIVFVIGFKNNEMTNSSVDNTMSGEEKKRHFMQSVGTIRVDTDAVKTLREEHNLTILPYLLKSCTNQTIN